MTDATPDAGAVGVPSCATPMGDALFLGHPARVQTIIATGNRAVTLDQATYWILWNTDTQAVLADGTGSDVALAASTLAVRQPTQIDLFDAMSGSSIGTLPLSGVAAFGVASDGSYVWNRRTALEAGCGNPGTMTGSHAGTAALNTPLAVLILDENLPG